MFKDDIVRLKDLPEKRWLSIFAIFTGKKMEERNRIIEEISRLDRTELRVRLMLALSEDLFSSKRAIEAVFLLERGLFESSQLKDPVKMMFFRCRYFQILDRFAFVNREDIKDELEDIIRTLEDSIVVRSNRTFFIASIDTIRKIKNLSEKFKKYLVAKISQRTFKEISLFYSDESLHDISVSLKEKDVHNILISLFEDTGSIDLAGEAGRFLKIYISKGQFIKAFDILIRLSSSERSEAVMVFFNIICEKKVPITKELREIVRFYVNSDDSIMKRVLFSNKFNSTEVICS